MLELQCATCMQPEQDIPIVLHRLLGHEVLTPLSVLPLMSTVLFTPYNLSHRGPIRGVVMILLSYPRSNMCPVSSPLSGISISARCEISRRCALVQLITSYSFDSTNSAWPLSHFIVAPPVYTFVSPHPQLIDLATFTERQHLLLQIVYTPGAAGFS